MTDLVEVIDELEAAPEGSFLLSDQVLLAVGWYKTIEDAPGYPEGTLKIWRKPDGTVSRGPLPDPTQDTQDALNLVPEGWRVYALQQNEDGLWFAGLDQYKGGKVVYSGRDYRATPALALSIVVLKARVSENTHISVPRETLKRHLYGTYFDRNETKRELKKLFETDVINTDA